MRIVDQLADALAAGNPPISAEVEAHCAAILERECGRGTLAELEEAAEEFVAEMIAETSGDHRYGGNLRVAAEEWAVEHGLDDD